MPGRVGDAGHERAQAGVGRQPGHGLHPGQRPGGGETVVDRPALVRGAAVRLGHRGDAGLEFQRRGHPVHGLQAQAAQVADVAVQVDEPRRHYLARHVDVATRNAGRQARSDGCDPVGRNGHVAHGVQA